MATRPAPSRTPVAGSGVELKLAEPVTLYESPPLRMNATSNSRVPVLGKPPLVCCDVAGPHAGWVKPAVPEKLHPGFCGLNVETVAPFTFTN